jgi:nitrite reductase (NO-forming)
MPNQNVSDTEIRQYIAYFKWADANLSPKGESAVPAIPAAKK